jgi:hypothetical protein
VPKAPPARAINASERLITIERRRFHMGTSEQSAYANVTRLEAALTHVMDGIPAAALGTEGVALRRAAAALEGVVALLEGVRERTAPVYERSPMANRV